MSVDLITAPTRIVLIQKKDIMGFFNIVTRIGAVLGAIVLVIGFAGAKGAPQEAAVAALAIALAVIPYVLARCVQMSRDELLAEQRHKDILAALNPDRKPANPAVQEVTRVHLG
ncbi:hypothetical protein [Polaromonas sp. OV174]|uniref:hypothetical protein n=1 Tax=Polaromonas sp. OV174 TaxID=1855300 RepID=UPI000B85BEEB|nr:hypothetical protein [Polaromonas sp. OV174]